jgi:hypothetical protein
MSPLVFSRFGPIDLATMIITKREERRALRIRGLAGDRFFATSVTAILGIGIATSVTMSAC